MPAVTSRYVERDMMRVGKCAEKSHEVKYDDVCHETVKQEEAKKRRVDYPHMAMLYS